MKLLQRMAQRARRHQADAVRPLDAEMLAMTRLEERHKFKCRKHLSTKFGGSILFTSLEPCPMCFTRWILSGVEKVFYAVAEPKSGMADCSLESSAFCLKLFICSQKADGGKQWQWK